ncbi:MAG: nucleotidyltransferase family protein [Bacteroidales bacterium]|nr:nucleotidyltransferase family protein [Bacteroidales bacterium]
MERNFNHDVYDFIEACGRKKVRMILVGGNAVNYYGYKRHSADIDFWVDNKPENLENLLKALKQLGHEISDFPPDVRTGDQNISLKFSPDLEIELITRLNPGKTFDEAFIDSVEFVAAGQRLLKWNVLSFEDLINSKIKAGRPKDLLDIQELQRIRKIK